MITTDIVWVDADKSLIEPYLTDKYGEIIRWAIVDIDNKKYKVTVSYIK